MKQVSLCTLSIPDRLFIYFICASFFLLPTVLPPQSPPWYTWNLFMFQLKALTQESLSNSQFFCLLWTHRAGPCAYVCVMVQPRGFCSSVKIRERIWVRVNMGLASELLERNLRRAFGSRCHVLWHGSESPSPDHTQGRGVTQTCLQRSWGTNGAPEGRLWRSLKGPGLAQNQTGREA